MLPIVLSEQLIQPFNCFLSGSVRQAMRHDTEFYGLVDEFAMTKRMQAYQIACSLKQQKVPVVITASSHRYAIWVNVRSPFYQQWLTDASLRHVEPPEVSIEKERLQSAVGR